LLRCRPGSTGRRAGARGTGLVGSCRRGAGLVQPRAPALPPAAGDIPS
jgi:hypothetical protein